MQSSVAVVVPAFNAGKTIEDTLRSIKQQTEPVFLIVIDDASTDNTAGIASSKCDLLVQNVARLGKSQSLNELIPRIQQEYVLIVDADTCLERRFIEILTERLNAYRVDCGSGFTVFIGKTEFARHVADEYNDNDSISDDDWRFNGCCQFYRTEFLKQHLFSTDCFVEDEEIYWRLRRTMRFRSMVVPALAYSLVPNEPRGWLKQRLRWERGAVWLLKKRLLPWHHIVPRGVYYLLPFVFMAVMAFFSGPDILLTALLATGLALFLLVLTDISKFGLDKNALKYAFLSHFMIYRALLEIFVFKKRFRVTDW